MTARVLRVSGAIVECHKEWERTNHLKGAAGKATLDSLLLTKDHIDTLQEIIDFLEPAVEFTHWAGNLASPTIFLIYPRIHSMLPPAETFSTKAVRDLHDNMSKFIEDAWPLESMPKAMLLAVFLNSAIASDPLFWMKNLFRWQNPLRQVQGDRNRSRVRVLGYGAQSQDREGQVGGKQGGEGKQAIGGQR
jgi:hypothetical protein